MPLYWAAYSEGSKYVSNYFVSKKNLQLFVVVFLLLLFFNFVLSIPFRNEIRHILYIYINNKRTRKNVTEQSRRDYRVRVRAFYCTYIRVYKI